MKTLLTIALLAFTLSACKEDSPENKAKRQGLVCINGWVFQSHTEYPLLSTPKTEITPLNIECQNGKVVVE